MIRDRENGVIVRLPELLFEQFHIRNLRLLSCGSDGESSLSAEIVNDTTDETAGYLNLTLSMDELRHAVDLSVGTRDAAEEQSQKGRSKP